MGDLVKQKNNHLTYEMGEVAQQEIQNAVNYVAGILEREFGFTAGMPSGGTDGYYLEVYKNDTFLAVGWDTWTGIFVSAESDEGDAVLKALFNQCEGES